MRPPVDPRSLRQVRRHLIEHGQCPPGQVDERLARSWQRSLRAGLMPEGRLLEPPHSSGQHLAHLTACNHQLIAHSRPVMQYLFDQVRHRQNLVVLAGPCGTLMHTLGDAYFVSKAERVALMAGASWHESHRGTNAIGTALAEQAPVEIHGGEHYLERNGFLTCAAAPIVSGAGELLGILDVSGEQRDGQPHALGLVSMAARMIENRLMATSYRQHIRLHVHTLAEGIGMVGEGILALSDDGWLVGANTAALQALGLNRQRINGVRIDDVLDLDVRTLLDHLHRQGERVLATRTHQGKQVFVQVQSRPDLVAHQMSVPVTAAQALTAPTVQADAVQADFPRTAAPAARTGVGDALSKLDTGDTRWRTAADKVRRVLGKPISVLIQGESGVGKEWFARAVHESGPRKEGPFVAINCAAVPENLIESELFGYAPGAFTGARKEGWKGLLRQAHGGTLFLDEIGDMPLQLQTRLLRVLQERQVTPLGGGNPVNVDFALICATNRKLRPDAEAGRFRSDLYYRINGLTVELPPLRERTDLPALTRRLLAEYAEHGPIGLAPDVEQALSTFGWPGNLRQLANVLRTACALMGPGERSLEWSHLPDDLLDDLRASPVAAAEAVSSGPITVMPAAQSLQDVSRNVILQTVENCRGNVALAARMLGISRQTIYRKMGKPGSQKE